ncbi:glycosyltransferase [Xenorhabdus siamensis]|uniref:glycosyltransferase n=1 Tax=Xenorhabdus siamensis TaxID=3136254 RepID=UPI0030F3713A
MNITELNKPLISIVTSTYQAVELLPVTIKSIRNQKFKNFEWIIVDNASGDGTKDLIINNQDIIKHWISEKDDGIYNAWNKALKMVSGDWIIFIGAGDNFFSNDTLLLASE